MSQNTIAQLEKTILSLPPDEQRQLIDRVAAKLRQGSVDDRDFEAQLAEMASDKHIQAELRRIDRDFADSEFDGLAE